MINKDTYSSKLIIYICKHLYLITWLSSWGPERRSIQPCCRLVVSWYSSLWSSHWRGETFQEAILQDEHILDGCVSLNVQISVMCRKCYGLIIQTVSFFSIILTCSFLCLRKQITVICWPVSVSAHMTCLQASIQLWPSCS